MIIALLVLLLEIVGVDGGRSCGGEFFVGIRDDIDSAARLGETLATSTGGQRLQIVHHVAGSC